MKIVANVPEELQGPFDQAMSFYDNQQWDQAIDACSDLLALVDKDPTTDSDFKSVTYHNRGLAYGNKGDFDRAIADFNKAIELNPNSNEAYNSRGIAYSSKGDFNSAIADFSKAIKLNPNSAEAYSIRGLAYIRQENFDHAIADFNKAIELNPNSNEAYNTRGVAYSKKGNFDHAIADFNKAIELNPNSNEAYNSRGIAYSSKGDFNSAIADFSKAIEIAPGFVAAYNNRGLVYIRQENFDHAIADYSKAIEIDPNYNEAYNNRGLAYSKKGNFDLAIADCNKAIELAPNSAEAYNNRGLAYSGKGDFDCAITNYDEAIERNPKFAEAYNNCGLAYSSKGNFDLAIADYDEAIEKNPEFVKAYCNRGIAYSSKGNFDRAITDCSKAINLSPNSDVAYSIRGLAYTNKGNFDRAIADFNKAIELNPNIAGAYNSRGIAYSSKGNFDRAITDYNKAIELNPNYDEAYNNRGFAYINKGDFDCAIADCSKAIEINPNLVVAYNNRGIAYSSKGDFDSAIADYKEAIKIDPKLFEAHNNLAFAYISKGDFNVIADFKETIKQKPDCISRSVPCYIISQVGSDKASQPLLKLHEAIQRIQTILIYQINKQAHNVVAHYTKLDTPKKLIKGEPFHLYNASSMDDTKEGKVFFDIIKNEEISGNAKNGQSIIEKLYHEQNDKKSLSPAYTGSFVQPQEDGTTEEHKKRRLLFWGTYGKDKGRKAAGACLHFGIDEFSDRPRSQFGAMGLLVLADSHFGPAHVSPPANCIYRVVYENQVWNIDGLKDAFQELVGVLKVITEQPQQPKVYQVAKEMLDEIRFLFKANKYQEEKELRIVETYYPSKDGQAKGVVKLDDNFSPPRPYIKAPPQLKLKEVIFGPRTQRIKEWKWWIEEENKSLNVKARQSEIKYRDNLFDKLKICWRGFAQWANDSIHLLKHTLMKKFS